MSTTLEGFVTAQARLLDLERDAEVSQSQDQFSTSDRTDKGHLNRLVLKGSAVKDVVVDSTRTGLFGRTQVTFRHKLLSNPLPANSFSNGTATRIMEHKKPRIRNTSQIMKFH